MSGNINETLTINELDTKFTIGENILQNVSECSTNIIALCLYPIKSCRGFAVQKWPLTDYGLYLDRHWCIYSQVTGKFLNIAKCASSLVIHSYIDLENKCLIIASHNMEKNFVLPILDNEFICEDIENLISITFYGDRTEKVFHDCGDKVAEWINEALGRKDCRLLRQTKLFKGNLSLVTGNLLLVNGKTVEYLAEKVAEDQGYFSIDLSEFCWRFRPNIIINNGKPMVENEWKSLLIDELELEIQELCERCRAINIDVNRLEYENYPLQHLRRMGNGKPDFGVRLRICQRNNKEYLSVGENIFIKESQ